MRTYVQWSPQADRFKWWQRQIGNLPLPPPLFGIFFLQCRFDSLKHPKKMGWFRDLTLSDHIFFGHLLLKLPLSYPGLSGSSMPEYPYTIQIHIYIYICIYIHRHAWEFLDNFRKGVPLYCTERVQEFSRVVWRFHVWSWSLIPSVRWG